MFWRWVCQFFCVNGGGLVFRDGVQPAVMSAAKSICISPQKGSDLRDAGLSPQKTRGVPTNRGKARRYTQTVLSARGGEERDARLSPQKARGVPTNRGKARRYTQRVLSARGGLASSPRDPGAQGRIDGLLVWRIRSDVR